MDLNQLRSRIAGDISVARTWSAAARARLLDTQWEAEGVPRATRRALLREIEGKSHQQIVAAYAHLSPLGILSDELAGSAATAAESVHDQATTDLLNFLETLDV